MNFKPLYDRILIKQIDSEEVSKGGIFIPDQAREKPVRGKVLATGHGRLNDDGTLTPLLIQEGDVVIYSKGAGNEIKIEEEKYLVITEDQIIAVEQ